MYVRNVSRALLVCAVAMAPLWAWAQTAQVSNRAALNGNAYFDWAGAGAVQSQPANGFSLASTGSNVKLTATTALANNLRLLKDTDIGFPAGDGTILEVGLTDNAGPLSIKFDIPVFGVGAQIDAAFSGVSMVAQLKLFDTANALLATFNTGLVDSLSEPFLGATSLSGIGRIEFDIIQLGGSDSSARFAINRLDILTSPVPEPHAVALFLAGLGVLGLAVRRRTR